MTESSDTTAIIGNIFEIDSSWIAGIDALIITAIITATASTIVGIAAYFIKRGFVKKDFEHQQNMEHSIWLLKKLHDVATHHYVGLARHLYDSETELKRAELSHDSKLIENAYKEIVKLLQKYNEFKNDTGANILFIERKTEDHALKKIRSLLISLPFDDDDHLRIISDDHDLPKKSFSNWVNSQYCINSKTQTQERLFQLRSIFDDESEKILQHEYFLKTRSYNEGNTWIKKFKKNPKIRKKSTCNLFYINKLSSMYATNNERIWLFGKGFLNESIKYSLCIKDNEIEYIVKDNESIQIIIPKDLDEGTYDVTANFTIHKIQKEEPTGLVVHVLDSKSLIERKASKLILKPVDLNNPKTE